MKRICEDCGEEFDDLDHWTICPHDYFQMNTVVTRGDGETKTVHSIEELDEFQKGYTRE